MSQGTFLSESEPQSEDPLRVSMAADSARAEANQRLQVGLSGLAAMVLLVGLASIIGSQADASRENAVPDAAPTTEPTEAPPQRDPLVDAGIVPDIPTEPEAEVIDSPVEDLPDSVVEDTAPTDDDAD